jgi:hypothetical protein
MTITTTQVRSSTYTGNGTTTAFSTGFEFIANGDLVVHLVTGGVETIAVPGTQYAVSGAGVETGGSITMTTAPAAGTLLWIERKTPINQTTAFSASYVSSQHEAAVDKLTLEVQEASYTADATLSKVMRESASVLDYIPEIEHAAIRGSSSSYDCSAAFNAALANHASVHAPSGRYKLKSKVSIPVNKSLFGDGRQITRILVQSDFSGTAVLEMIGGEPGAEISHIGIEFDQPSDPVDVSGLVSYPPAIKATNTPRFRIRGMRITRAMVGIDMTGNSGGARIDDLEMSAFVTGIKIDGSLDTVSINKLHFWVFGLTAAQRTIYSGPANRGIDCRRCDDFNLTNSILFSVPNAALFNLDGAGAGVFGNITGCDFDDRGGLIVNGGSLQLAGCFFSLGKADAQLVKVGGGFVTIASSRFFVATVPALPPIELAGSGLLSLSGCNINRNSVNQKIIASNATGSGQLMLTGCFLGQNPAASFSEPYIDVSAGGARLSMVGCQSQGRGLETGTNVLVNANTSAFTIIKDNNLGGNEVSLPATFTLNNAVSGNLNVGVNGGSEVTAKFLLGEPRIMVLTGNLDASGNLTVAHGIGNLGQRGLRAQIWYRSAPSTMKPMAIASIDNTDLAATGGTANALYRLVIEASRWNHPTW